ncbi:MAG: DUF1318 domain-containing protein [Verrucomicrobiota bacterium]
MKNNTIWGCGSWVTVALLLVSCAPTIRLDTPDPVKIDVAMQVDVYTHQEKSSGMAGADKENKTPRERRRNRMAEVQNLKNDRVIGEGNTGFLAVKNPPTDPVYADYAQKIVTLENEDRQLIFQAEASAEDKPADMVAKDFSKRARESSFPGEWIQQEDGTWIEK